MKQEIRRRGIKSSNFKMLKSNFEFDVLVNGHSAREYYHEGRNYIEGREGTKFSIRMRNNSSNRVLFVPTIDGLSIMNGKEASYKSRGYIVNSYDSLTIDGWRTSDDKVAEFFFSSPKGSYAVKKNKGSNLGVIGCAVFKEKEQVKVIERIIEKEKYIPYQPWPTWPIYWTSSSGGTMGKSWNTLGGGGSTTTFTTANNGIGSSISSDNLSSAPQNCSYSMQTSSAGLGTGFGQDKYSPVSTVSFDKEDHPTEVFTIFYNTREKLESMGVEFKKAVYIAPSAFPNEDGYCERPN
jgi:hypothetical protein